MSAPRAHRNLSSPGLALLAVAVLAAALLLLGRGVGAGRERGGAASRSGPVPSTPGESATVTARPDPSSGALSVVPWIDASPGPLAAATPVESSAPQAPPDLADCTPADLVANAFYQGATGSMAGSVTVANASRAACALGVAPAVQVVGSRAGVLRVFRPSGPRPPSGQSGAPAATSGSTRMLLVPGARASLQLQWFNWCGTASPGTIAFHLSLPTGTLVAPAEWPAPGGGTPNPEAEVPRCDDPQAPSTLSVGGFQLVPANTATPAPDLLANVRVVLAAPATAAPGEAIAYRVALTDTRSDPVPLTPCPTYLEALVPAIGLPIAKELHALNCAPVGTLDPGRPVTFAMVLQVPAGAPAGSASLSWEFVGPGLPAPPRAALTITSP